MGIASSVVRGAKSLLSGTKVVAGADPAMGAADVLGDVATGAAAGAGIGSVVPVVGTGIGAAVGGAAGGLWDLIKTHRWSTAQVIGGALPIIKDIFENGVDPQKLEAISKARDARAEQLMGSDPSMTRQKATDAANAELAPFIEEASRGPSSTGDKVMDAAGLAVDVGGALNAWRLGKLAGIGKKMNANAPTPGGPATASEPLAGTADMGNFKSAGRTAMESGAGDRVTADPSGEQLKLTGGVPGTGFTMPQSGGTMPMDQGELMRMMMAAKLRQQPKQSPPMYRSPMLNLEG